MSWNYRVVREGFVTVNTPDAPNTFGDYFTIREVYYDEHGKPNGVTEEAVGFGGDDLFELKRALALAALALERPILDIDKDFQKP